jgi:multiple sugar transport system substrate-binding protein
MTRPLLAAMLAATIALLVGACGGDGDADRGGRSTEAGAAKNGARVIDADALADARGSVTVCQEKDLSGNITEAIERFNAEQDAVRAKLIQFAAKADDQRTQFVQRQQARSSECDVFHSDVIWTAEFASQRWIYDMTPYVERRKEELIPATLEAATYEGRYWGMPQDTGAGLLYYRSDQLDEPPRTWQDAYRAAAEHDGIVYQGASYEGLTVDFLELAFAAGGSVLSSDGRKATIDSPENLAALRLMVDGVRGGAAPRAVTTYTEEEARRYWEQGKATLMRNWPYAYSLGQAKRSRVAGKFDVSALPAFEGGGRAGVLGGHNMVISVYSRNPAAALKFIDFYTSPEWQRHTFDEYSLPVPTASVYDDPAIRDKYPFAAELKTAIAQAKPRPASPVYPMISQAIYENVNAALSGQKSPEDALAAAQSEIEAALRTF